MAIQNKLSRLSRLEKQAKAGSGESKAANEEGMANIEQQPPQMLTTKGTD